MKGYQTSFTRLFEAHPADAPVISKVEIPLIQRDYAQGRQDTKVEEIRTRFLNVLYAALVGPENLDLDFIYGDVDSGTLRPLDGQQRLTTLFLLHWYLACRTGDLVSKPRWAEFSYATRPSAETFCRRLASRLTQFPPRDVTVVERWTPSKWITDQPWYLHVWRNDPTIRSMLVMIDAIHQLFAGDEADFIGRAWTRLEEDGAISFQLLPIQEIGAGEELYIKMNSRGKPLTPFENFKARFEQTIVHSPRAKEFARKVDREWSDLMWHHRGDDNIVDDEFIRYFEFVIEVCEWKEGLLVDGALEPRADRIFGAGNPRAAEHLDYVFRAFDVWSSETHIASTFDNLFASPDDAAEGHDPSKVVVFGTNVNVNLFEACCQTYGERSGNARVFPFGQTLLLHAVLLHLDPDRDTRDFPRRLRMLRNLVAASENEVRRENMPKLIDETDLIIVEGTLDGVATFNQSQVADELLKQARLSEHPEAAETVFRLEDHTLLRGSLVAFDLDAETFDAEALGRRGEAFDRVFTDPSHWPAVTGALLATGEYQRKRWSAHRFGTGARDESIWRWILTGGTRPTLESTRRVLGEFLDLVSASRLPVLEHLGAVSSAFISEREQSREFDWRYYLVRYDAMREGRSGLYIGEDGELGYTMIMLRKWRLTAYYRDPYLLAIHRESGVGDAVRDSWFQFSEKNPRWMELERSSTRIRNIAEGLLLRPPTAVEHAGAFDRICAKRTDLMKRDDDWLVAIPQAERDGRLVDTQDRVQVGAALLKDMVEVGL